MSSFGYNIKSKDQVHKYYQNGTGRDAYIYTNNGGFTASMSNTGLDQPGTMWKPKVYVGPSAGMKFKPAESKPIHYV